MTEIIYVKPREGVDVKDSRGRLIPREGKQLIRDTYIGRRLRDGDLINITPNKAKEDN